MERQELTTHHVLPNKNGGWDIKKTNAKRASRHFSTKKEAIDAAKIICENEGTELVIHDKTAVEETTLKPQPIIEKRTTVSTKEKAALSAMDYALIIAVLLGVGLLIYFWSLGVFTSEII
jgi:hypothetical protein